MFFPNTYRNFSVVLGKLQVALAERSFAGVRAVAADLVRLLDSEVVQNGSCSRPPVGHELAYAHVAVLGARALLAKLVLAAFPVEPIDSRPCTHV